MSRLAALTIRERSLVSSTDAPSTDSRENGTLNCPTVAPHARCDSRMKTSVAEKASGAAAAGPTPLVLISICARYDAQGVTFPSTAKRTRRRKDDAEWPSVWNRGWK